MTSHYLERLFTPRSVAVAGASTREGSLGLGFAVQPHSDDPAVTEYAREIAAPT